MDNDRVNRRWTAAEEETHNKPPKRRRRVFAGTMIAIAALAGLAWLAYPRLKPYGIAFNEFPGVKQTVGTVGEKMAGLESRWNAWLEEHQDFKDRLQKTESRVGSFLRTAKSQAQEIGDNVYLRLKQELDERDSAMNMRLAKLESQSNEEQMKLASLKDELAQLRADSSTQSSKLAEQLANMEQNTQRNFDGVNQHLSDVTERVRSGSNGDPGRQTFREGARMDRIGFEAAFNRDTTVAPGITLYITATDVVKKKVDGWVWLTPDNKTLWLHAQDAMQPTVFYSKEDGKRRELVFTGVTKTGAAGYVLVPAKPATGETPSDE